MEFINNGKFIYEKAKDACVTMETIYIVDNEPQTFVGSGFFISKDGYLLTNAHNIINFSEYNEQTEEFLQFAELYIVVRNIDGTGNNTVITQNDIQVIGVDQMADLAVLKLDLSDQTFLKWSDSRKARKGDNCYTIGNPFLADYNSIASGIIRDNKYYTNDERLGGPEQILTDIPTYGGNSGGPILDDCGKILGIMSFIFINNDEEGAYAMSGGTSQWMGEKIVKKIINSGSDNVGTILGIQAAALFPVEYTFNNLPVPEWIGVLPTDVVANSPVSEVLLTVDFITHADGIPIGVLDNQFGISAATWLKSPGDESTFDIIKLNSGNSIQRTIELISIEFGSPEFNQPGVALVSEDVTYDKKSKKRIMKTHLKKNKGKFRKSDLKKIYKKHVVKYKKSKIKRAKVLNKRVKVKK